MKDELKEILNYLKENDDKDIFGYVKDKILSYEEANTILDYITNLQESEAYYYGYYKDYKSRNEKALRRIDYTNYIECDNEEKWFNYLTELKNILNGGDE